VARISIVTPTLNQAATLRETIESVLTQDHPDLEYWVFDAGSSDGTQAILREYEHDSRFHWCSEPDQGQSDAVNKGLARATGDIFNWLNSDDYLVPGALKKVARAFQASPQPDIVSGLTGEFRHPGPEVYNYIRLQVRSSPEETITVGVFCQPSTFWRTDIFRALGGLETSLHFTMDWHLWVKYLARYGQDKILLLPDPLAHYRHHARAKTSKDSGKFYGDVDRVFHDLNAAVHAPPEFLDEQVRSTLPLAFVLSPGFDRGLYLGRYAERMVRIYRKKDPALAKKWLRRAFRHKPGLTWWRVKMALRLGLGPSRD
jgi:glycosyltransferase involved in cell wall biosynthesis